MKISIVLFLSFMVRDVFSLRGLYSAEVSILGEGEVPSDTEMQMTCTISTIEPAGTDVKFVNYIASSEEAMLKSFSWRDNSTVQTFEECADAAAASGAKMFLFDEQRCQLSDSVYEKTNLCSKDHSQMVYMDVDAVTDNDHGLFCNYDWSLSCTAGKCINTFAENGNECSEGIKVAHTHEGRYHLFASKYDVNLEDHSAECEKYGALPCAPANESSIADFVDQLIELKIEANNDITVGIESTNSGNSYTWATGVNMPLDHAGWDEYDFDSDMSCCFMTDEGVSTWDCDFADTFCCMVPYYAN